MKIKILFGISVCLLFVPFVGHAADVVFSGGTDAQITVSTGTYTLTDGTSNDNVNYVTVEADSFDVHFTNGGDQFMVTSSSGHTFNITNASSVTRTDTCSSGTSTMKLTNPTQSDLTVTVTPSTSGCTPSSSSGGTGGGGGSSGGGGGGGGGGSITPPTPPTPPPAVTTLPAPTTSAAGMLTPEKAVEFKTYVAKFTAPLKVGSKSTLVTWLQKILNSDPDTLVASVGFGSSGKETSFFGKATKEAVIKFQLKHGIIQDRKDVGTGNVGPKTRGKLQELFGGEASAIPSPPPSSSSNTTIQDLQQRINELLQQLNVLRGTS